ncbi:MAG: phage baseplate assembly protein V [Planctomycetota bacterium]
MATLIDVKKYLHSRLQRILLMIGRGVITLVEGKRCQVYLQNEEVLDRIEFFGAYGISSRPKPGAECVTVFIGGSREHGIIIATRDKRYEMSLNEGEVALHGAEGQYVKMKAGGDIEAVGNNITATAVTSATVTSATVTITGTTSVTVNTGSNPVNVNAGTVNVNAGLIKLGSGATQGIARLGDTAQHTCRFDSTTVNSAIVTCSTVVKSL